MGEPFTLKVKIILVGNSEVGKTSLIRRYVMDIFDDRYITTLGTKVSKKRLIIKKNETDVDLTFSIWDILGQEEFSNIQAMAFKGAKGALLVCDLTRNETLQSITGWVTRVKEVTGEIPMILLANKADLTGDYAFTEDDIKAVTTQLKIPYYFTSAKFGDNVIKTFYSIGDMVTDAIFKGQ